MKSKEERLEAFKQKLIKKGKTPDEIARRLEVRSKMQNVGVGLGKVVAGAASSFISAAPVPIATAGKLLSKVPAVKAVPVIGSVVQVAEIQFDSNVQEHGNVLNAVMSEFVPLLQEVKDGEYLKAGLTVAGFVAIGVAVFFLI